MSHTRVKGVNCRLPWPWQKIIVVSVCLSAKWGHPFTFLGQRTSRIVFRSVKRRCGSSSLCMICQWRFIYSPGQVSTRRPEEQSCITLIWTSRPLPWTGRSAKSNRTSASTSPSSFITVHTEPELTNTTSHLSHSFPVCQAVFLSAVCLVCCLSPSDVLSVVSQVCVCSEQQVSLRSSSVIIGFGPLAADYWSTAIKAARESEGWCRTARVCGSD